MGESQSEHQNVPCAAGDKPVTKNTINAMDEQRGRKQVGRKKRERTRVAREVARQKQALIRPQPESKEEKRVETLRMNSMQATQQPPPQGLQERRRVYTSRSEQCDPLNQTQRRKNKTKGEENDRRLMPPTPRRAGPQGKRETRRDCRPQVQRGGSSGQRLKKKKSSPSVMSRRNVRKAADHHS